MEIEARGFPLHETPDAVPAADELKNEAFSVAWSPPDAEQEQELEQDRPPAEIPPFWLEAPISPGAGFNARQWTLDLLLPLNLEAEINRDGQPAVESVPLTLDGLAPAAPVQAESVLPFPLRRAVAGAEPSVVEAPELVAPDASVSELDPAPAETGEIVFKLHLQPAEGREPHDNASARLRSETVSILNHSVPRRTIQDPAGSGAGDNSAEGVRGKPRENPAEVEHFAPAIRGAGQLDAGENDSGTQGARYPAHGLKEPARPDGEINPVTNSVTLHSAPQGGEPQQAAVGKSSQAHANPVRYQEVADVPASSVPAGQPLRSLSFQIGGAASGRVQIHLTERDGGISLAVRGADPAINRDLRQDLDSLLTRLHDNGFTARLVEESLSGHISGEPAGREQYSEKRHFPGESGGQEGRRREDSHQKQDRRTAAGHTQESFSRLLAGIAPDSFQLQPLSGVK
jgi:hypothetical protein